jgi:hypothetical protein
MVVFLLLARRWRAFAAACASWLAVALVMTARYGVACWPQFFRLQGPIGARWIGDLRNASLHGIVLRWFHPVCLRLTGTVPRATAIAIVLSLALVAGAWWLTRPLVAAKKIDLPFALFALIATFVNPWSWEHYDVLLLLPWLIAATTLWRGRREQPAWTLAVGGALLAAVVWMLGVDMSIKGRWLHEWLTTHDRRAHLRLHVYEVVNWLPQLVLIALVAALAALQARKSRGSAGRTTGQL